MSKSIVTDNIGQRPAYLEVLKHYKILPEKPIGFDFESIPELLKLNILALEGIKPLTTCVLPFVSSGFTANPNSKEIEFYRIQNTLFQMVHVVANVFDIHDKGDHLVSKPYALNLIPAVKRGQPETVTIDFLERFDLGKELIPDMVYANLNPFSGEAFFGGPYSIVVGDRGQKWHTDAVGFILGTYFLKNNFEMEDAMIPFKISETDAQEKYAKYLKKRLYRWFVDTKPRKLWGVDSPIELFLAHALSKEGLYPDIQTIILDDGRVFPSFFHMFGEGEKIGDAKIITEADFYFPSYKLAILCDSLQYHRGAKNKNKDLKINEKLHQLGIKCLRVRSDEIFRDLGSVVQRIKHFIV